MFKKKSSGRPPVSETGIYAKWVFVVTTFIGLGLVLIGSGFCQEFEIGEIVVTAKKGYERNAMSIPANITVITSEDIAKSNARTVVDLLRTEVGLVVRDLYGNGGQASVDIRGFGEAAAMNCAILIDGRRVNNIDMSNPDLNQISLAQIERIEILRGGAGALYGDSAIGGVVNIITRKPKKREITSNISFNAFNGTDLKFGMGDVKKEVAYSINGSYRFSQGYRIHSEMNAGDIGVKIKAEESGLVPGWDLSAGLHLDNYQFPGPIDQTDWDSGYLQRSYIWGGWPFGPIKSTVPLDYGNSMDLYSKLAVQKSIGPVKTETEISLRSRNAKSFMDSWSMYDRRYTRILGAGEKMSWDLFGVDFLGGLEYYSTSYNISPDKRTGEPTPSNDDQRLQCQSLGGYFQVNLPIVKNIFLEAGGRIENFNQHFIVESVSSDTFRSELVDALYAGLSLKIIDGMNTYLRWSRSFRMPKTDEYYTWGVYNPLLKPQKGEDVELGMKYTKEKIAANLSLFLTRVSNEIYYHYYGPLDPRNKNENYPDPTLRMGGEIQVSAQLFNFASISCGYTLTDAKFDTGGTGIYQGKEIPLVPRHKGDIKLRLNLPFDIGFGINCTLVSERWFGSDYTQTGGKLPGYGVVDINFSRQFENLRLFGAITNLGDVKYAESAYMGTYYPLPVRNFTLGMEVNL